MRYENHFFFEEKANKQKKKISKRKQIYKHSIYLGHSNIDKMIKT